MSSARALSVAQVVLSLNFGGLEYLCIQLCEELEKRGIRGQIISLTDGVLADEARQRGVKTTLLGKKSGLDLKAILRLREIIKEEGIDIVHTHNFAPLVHGTLAAAGTGARTLNTRHGPDPQSAPRFIWGMNEVVVAVSDHSRQELIKFNKVNPEKLRVILNGIDLSDYASPPQETDILRREFNLPPETKIVGNFSRLAAEKDQATLLRAFRILMDQGVNARLMIAGGGPLEGELKALASELNLNGSVHFLGFRKGIPDLLRSLDLYVISSVMEGLSLSLVQAMASGLPIVATKAGGNGEAVADGQSGLLVECGDHEGLAKSMKRILEDPETARRFAHRAREDAFRLFTIDRMAESYVELYREVMARRGVRV
ncbi:MAG TPA: glycosyltransferase [Tepidisphaeraceae bacterium]|nr:glycosyltransferase [Tepidisphaeraceae bacterium]